MSKTYIVHGTQYFEKEVQLQINAPNMEQAEIRAGEITKGKSTQSGICLLYTSPSPRDLSTSRMPSSA